MNGEQYAQLVDMRHLLLRDPISNYPGNFRRSSLRGKMRIGSKQPTISFGEEKFRIKV
jgi:hypothetical protein